MFFRLPWSLALFLALALASPICDAEDAVEPPLAKGDKVMLTAETQVKSQQVQIAVTKGSELLAEKSQDGWVWVTVKQEGEKFSGWIAAADLRLIPTVRAGDWVAVRQGEKITFTS